MGRSTYPELSSVHLVTRGQNSNKHDSVSSIHTTIVSFIFNRSLHSFCFTINVVPFGLQTKLENQILRRLFHKVECRIQGHVTIAKNSSEFYRIQFCHRQYVLSRSYKVYYFSLIIFHMQSSDVIEFNIQIYILFAYERPLCTHLC